MEPRWPVIGVVIGLIAVGVVCFVACNFVYTVWTEMNQEIAGFLGAMNDIGKEEKTFGEQMKGVLALGMIGLVILGVVRILASRQ